MAWFPRPSRPSEAFGDLGRFLGSGDHRHRLLFGFVAVLLPVLMVLGFQRDATPEPPRPTLVMVENWPANRTDAQIVAQQKIDADKQAKAFEARRRSYERLAKTLGLE